MADSVDTRLALLQCSLCHQVPLMPWYACPSGHLVCTRCSLHATACGAPQCTQRLKQPLPRITALEYFVAHQQPPLMVPCRNAGCKEQVPVGKAHTGCNYEHIKCPVAASCTWRGTVSELEAHTETRHTSPIVTLVPNVRKQLTNTTCTRVVYKDLRFLVVTDATTGVTTLMLLTRTATTIDIWFDVFRIGWKQRCCMTVTASHLPGGHMVVLNAPCPEAVPQLTYYVMVMPVRQPTVPVMAKKRVRVEEEEDVAASQPPSKALRRALQPPSSSSSSSSDHEDVDGVKD